MTDVFFAVVKMDAYGLIAAWIVMIALLVLGRTRVSKTALLLLWLVVGFRLVCPWSPPSPLSLFNWDAVSEGAQDISRLEDTYVGDTQVAVKFLDGNHEEFDRAVAAGARPELNDSIHMQVAYYYQDEAGNITPARTFREVYGGIAAAVWSTVAAGLVVYSGVSYFLLKRKLRFAVRDEERPGVWYSDRIPSPCVAGLLRPQIYLTFGMTGEERDYVLAHERQHIKNGDHVWKVLGWLILCVHWFDPLMWSLWTAFLSTLEEACDQRVLRELGEDKKADYGQALLSLSCEKRFRPGFSPLAFGEGDTKGRVRTVLKYKTPLAWLTAIAVIVGAVVGLSVLTSRAEREEEPSAAAGIEAAYGTWRPSAVVHQTAVSSMTWGYLLDRHRQDEISVDAGALILSGNVSYIARSPVYEPMELGDTLLTTGIGGEDDEEAARLFSLDLTKYESVQGWMVMESVGPEEYRDTGWHIFLADGKLWLGKWVVHASTPYGEYRYILECERTGDAGDAGAADSNLQDAAAIEPPGEAVAWEYRPGTSGQNPGFRFILSFHADCDRLELRCETGRLWLWDGSDPTQVPLGPVSPDEEDAGGGRSLTVDRSYATVYWIPWTAGGIADRDTVSLTVYQDGEEVGGVTIYITQTDSQDGAYTYTAQAVLSDSEHYYFTAEDSEQGGAIVGGGPDWWPSFTFTARVTASDPDLGTLTVEPEKDLLDGLSRFRFEFWEPSEYHAGDRVLVTARHIITQPDGQTEEGVGTFGQVDGLIPLSHPVAEWKVDLTHDGTDERVFVADDGGETWGIFYLVVENAAGDVLWTDGASLSHAGQNGFYLYKGDDERYYLLNWVPYMGSGMGDYHYHLFSLSETGEERTVLKGSVEPDFNDVWGADPADLRAFEKEINSLLDNSVVLLSTNGDTPRGGPKVGYYGSAEDPVIPIGPWDSGAEYFEGLQALAQGTYTFTGEVVSVQEDRYMVVDQSLWTDLQSYVFSIPVGVSVPVDALGTQGKIAEGDMVTVTADGPLYRWKLPGEGTHVTISPVLERAHPISGGNR